MFVPDLGGNIEKQRFCKDCLNKEEKYFRMIYNCARDNPNYSIEEIQKITEVPLHIIERMIKSGRLQQGKAKASGCTRCGAPLGEENFAKVCLMCSKKIATQISQTQSGSPPPQSVSAQPEKRYGLGS